MELTELPMETHILYTLSHTHAIIYDYVQALLHSLLTLIKPELYLTVSLFVFYFLLCRYASSIEADALLTAASLEHIGHMLEVNRYVLMEHMNESMQNSHLPGVS